MSNIGRFGAGANPTYSRIASQLRRGDDKFRELREDRIICSTKGRYLPMPLWLDAALARAAHDLEISPQELIRCLLTDTLPWFPEPQEDFEDYGDYVDRLNEICHMSKRGR